MEISDSDDSSDSDESSNSGNELNEWEALKKILDKMGKKPSMFRSKMDLMLSRYREFNESEEEDVFIDATLYIMKFFSRNADRDDDFLTKGFDEFLAIIKENFNSFAGTESFGKSCIQLEVNQKSPLFLKSPEYWKLLYEMMKIKRHLDWEDYEDVEILGILESFSMRFIEDNRYTRPMSTHALMVLQRMHDTFEEHGCCSKNQETLLFYFNELLTNTDIRSETLKDDPKFDDIIRNTKIEIVRLLKCIFGYNFKSCRGSHSFNPRKHPKIDVELAERILDFYLPIDMDLIVEGKKEVDVELLEMCQKLRSTIETRISATVLYEFETNFELIQHYVPHCFEIKGQMEDLSLCKRYRLPQVKRIPDKSRLILANTFYVLAHNGFHQKSNDYVLCLAKQVIMFGHDLLDRKLLAQVWFYIAKCLCKNLDPPNFNVSQRTKVLFGFYISLMLNKEEANTHIHLAVTLHRLYSFHRSYLTSRTVSSAKNVKISNELMERFNTHVLFGTTYIQKKTRIEHVASIMQLFLMEIQENQIGISNDYVEQFFTTGIAHLDKLVEEQQDSSNHNERDTKLLIQNLKKTWSDTVKKFQQKENEPNFEEESQSNNNDDQMELDNQSSFQLNSQENSTSQEIDDQISFAQNQSDEQTPPDPTNNESNSNDQNDSTSHEQSSEKNCLTTKNRSNKKNHLDMRKKHKKKEEENASREDENDTPDEDSSNDGESSTKQNKRQSMQLFQQFIESAVKDEKAKYESKLKRVEKKFNDSITEIEAKNLELQTQLNKMMEERDQLAKDKKQLEKANQEMRQELEDEEEERRLRLKRRQLEEEEDRLREAKKARRSQANID